MGLIMHTLAIINYLADSGATFAEGDTLGDNYKPEFFVRLRENGILGDGPVYRITEAARLAH